MLVTRGALLTSLFATGLALASGCGFLLDADGDGLSNAKERRLGTDKHLADSDGDGLSDFEEVELGTDPTLADSDGDSYSDGHERHYGSDPLDADDRIYFGYWPYNPDKDDIVDPGLSGRAKLGEVVGRFKGVDQFGEEVDLYDFAGHGKPVVVDISAEWCPPCRMMSYWLNGSTTEDWTGDPVLSQSGAGYVQGVAQYVAQMDAEFGVVREAVENGDLYWVTIIYEDWYGNPATEQTVARWYQFFPDERVPVLEDNAGVMARHYNLEFFPSIYLLDEDMTYVKGPSSQSWDPPLVELKAMFE